jgi:putative NIF3 family GTP cyclohydrolase 1 type 2
LETAEELKIETVIPRGLERTVVQAMLAAHPYEEVAYDLYPLEQSPASTGLVKGLGYGFWGDFAKPRAFSEVLRDVRRLFKVEGYLLTESESFQLGQPKGKKIRRVAFAAGKGASVVPAAASLGCDLMITGEAGYHEALAARSSSMSVVELGHTESERFFVKTVRSWLKRSGVQATELYVRTQRFE